MGVCVFSAQPSFIDVVKSALKTGNVIAFTDTEALLPELIRRASSKCNLLVLDLSSGPDAVRLVSFVKSSPQLSRVPIVAVGTEEIYASMEPGIVAGIEATLLHPLNATEVAAVVAKIRERLNPDAPH
jgi:response regulator RpfG family c-di-GMP phosphodiesterase